MVWLLANWKLVLFAAVVAALAWTGWSLYDAGRDAARQAAQVEALRADLATERANRKRVEENLLADQQRAQTDARQIAELKNRINQLNDYTPDPLPPGGSDGGLSGADVEWLRGLWQ